MAGLPRIVAFLCDACAYQAADRAGQARLDVPQSLLAVRVPCTGRVEPALVLQAFREGADGVLVAGCHPGDCRHVDGNVRASARHALLVRALAQAGVDPRRLRLGWASANEGERLAALARELTEDLRALGPLERGPPAPYGNGGARAPSAAGHAAAGDAATARDAAEPAGARSAAAEHDATGRDAARSAAVERAAAGRAARRPRLALYWNASCGGCDEAVLDLGEPLAALLERVEVVLWPAAFDGKRRDVEALPDGAIDVALVNGALRVEEHADWARLLRRKARILAAFGACAQSGGVVGLGNLSSPAELLEAAYRRPPSVSNREASLPGARFAEAGHELTLPALLPRVLPLAGAVPVDCTIPGCPPSPAVISAALEALLFGEPPPPGAVLAPNVALCEACPRRDSRPERLEIAALRRLDTSSADPVACFLAQGLVCLGPATRQGCQPGCVEAGMPCRGCFGPLDGAPEGGAAMLSAFASLLAGGEPEVRALAGAVADPAGTFWRYALAAGLPGGADPAARRRGARARRDGEGAE